MSNYSDFEPVETQEEFEASRERIQNFLRSLTRNELTVLALVYALPTEFFQIFYNPSQPSKWLLFVNRMVYESSGMHVPHFMEVARTLSLRAVEYLKFPGNVGERSVDYVFPSAIGVFEFLYGSEDCLRLGYTLLDRMHGKEVSFVRDMRTRGEHLEMIANGEKGIFTEIKDRIEQARLQERAESRL